MHEDVEQPTPEQQNAARAYGDGHRERDQVERAFTYHQPKGDQPARYVLLRDTAKTLALYILDAVPPSREKALALTKLEESIMWANAGIARNE